MEELPVTCSLGVIGPLLAKLHSVTEGQRTLPEEVSKDDLLGFTKDLEEARDFIVKLSKVEDPSFTDKCLMKEVREICYDAEDYLHVVLHRSAGINNKVMQQQRRMIAEDISELAARLQGAKRRRERCQNPVLTDAMKQDDCGEGGKSCQYALTGFDSIVNPMLKNPHAVLDEPMKELTDLLALDSEPQLKVVSIFGLPATGKTTLARTLFNRYGGRFHCRAFLWVSRSPDTWRLLMSLLSQIKEPQPRPQGICDIQALINYIRKLLQGKRYLIVVDDLWGSPVWDIIRFVFPEGDHFSRIISTTQVEVVASACCGYRSRNIYEMRPFKDDGQSQYTFFGPSNRTKEVLNLIYKNLPAHLKTCLLYFNMYPEDSVIRKDDLVKQWVAEGFLGALRWPDAEKLARSYFDEIVTRGMIQAVETNYNSEVLSCTVHHMVQDLIASKSREENFITVVGYLETMGLPDKVRRLSLNDGGTKSAQIPGNFRMRQVRSLLFSGILRSVPSIVKYRLLRILILHVWADEEKTGFDLTRIFELFLLKYLKIECNIPVILPDQMEGLQFLETLEVDARLDAVPLDIVRLQSLLHLRLPGGTDLPHGIGGMASLLTLGFFDLSSNSEDNVRNLGQLSKLQDLYLTCSREVSDDHLLGKIEVLGSVVRSLSNLKSLTLVPGTAHGSTNDVGPTTMSIFCDGLNIVSSPQSLLERLIFFRQLCIFSSLPRWIAELRMLCILKITTRVLQQNDINILEGLNCLTALSLYVLTAPEERIVFDKEGFPVLKHFSFTCSKLRLAFVEGAMSNVRRLKLGFNANGIELYSWINNAGFKNLTSVEMLDVKIGAAVADDESVRKHVQSALKDSFGQRGTCPIINVLLVDRIFYNDKEKSKAAQREQLGRSVSAGSKSRPGQYTNYPLLAAHNLSTIKQPVPRAMEFATGALGTLLPKLAQLLRDEYNLHKGAKTNIVFLTRELESVQAALRNVSEVPREELNELVKIWARDARELSYDMEDMVDTFLLRVQGPDDLHSKRSTKRFIKKMVGFITKAMTRHDIGQEIKDIKERVEEVARRRDRYKVDVAIPAKTSVDPSIAALYNKAADLVGIDEASQELIMRLTKDDDKSAQQRIVSVVGFGGLGKTTLAKAVYDKLKGQFDCTAFVPVGRNPDLKKVFKDISVDLGMRINLEIFDERQLIDILREFLQNERYFLVIDDVWETQSWETIKLAFVENNRANRIITTTRKHEVARKAGEVYKMQPLSHDYSRKLFFERIFGCGSKSSDGQSDDEVSDKILRKCGGIPLAIITMASLLVDKPMDEWSEVHRSTGFANKENQQVENTEKILSFSYYDLPSHLRTCLLYLSVLPEDHSIEKSTLVWMWIAEGFVQEKQGMSSFEIGEGYFNELVNRSLIQLVEKEDYLYGMVSCRCQIHDMVLDLIRSISSEENFVTTLGNSNELVGRLRRIAIQNDRTLKVNTEMQLVRSFISWRWDIDKGISLSSFKLVRVLAVHGNSYSHFNDQRHLHVPLRNLLHLRYLQISICNIVLPAEEIATQKFLQTLDVGGYGPTNEVVITSVAHLTQLMCLRLRSRVNTVPDGIGKLTFLEELEICFEDQEVPWRRFVKEVCGLRELRVLHLSISHPSMADMVLQLLHNLQKLEILLLSSSPPVVHADTAAWEAAGLLLSRRLKGLSLRKICFSRFPSFCINPSRLPHLSQLSLCVDAMDEQDLRILGGLPQLRFLELSVQSIIEVQVCNDTRTQEDACLFQKLRRWSIWYSGGLRFLLPSQEQDSGSSVSMRHVHTYTDLGSQRAEDTVRKAAGVAPTLMPSVQQLGFGVYVQEFMKDGNHDDDRVNLALQYFASLQDVYVWIACDEDSSAAEKAEAALRRAADVHPNRPTLKVERRNTANKAE